MNSLLQSQLATLQDDDGYDDEFLRPTRHAIEMANKWLAEVAYLPSGGHVSTVGDGGVRIEWSNDDKRIHLVIAGEVSGRTYIYHQDGSAYGVDRNVSGSNLVNWLRWLIVPVDLSGLLGYHYTDELHVKVFGVDREITSLPMPALQARPATMEASD